VRTARAAAAALLAVVACAHHPAAPSYVASDAPPVPLTSAEPHPEPDLVGVTHVVKRGETLYRIARTYGVSVAELMEVNGLGDPRSLEVGSELFVPGATRSLEVPPVGPSAGPETEAEVELEAEPESPARPPAPGKPAPPRPPPPKLAQAKAAGLRWPLQGVLYSRYGVRQGQRHDGIDIAAPEGSSVGAAAAGSVVYAGEQSGYGSIVILRHDGGLLTLYAHASAILVRQGERVSAGQPIAKVGRSGRTTGPHLHFEVRDGTRPRNPLFYLP
jgi:murein DD-endopeptidase MepM/ murein hydrolase activator NlpD